MTLRATLPDLDALDHEALKTLICIQHEQLLSQSEELLTKNEQLASREVEIEHLKLLIAKLRRMQFGCSSEKLDRKINQLELRLEEAYLRNVLSCIAEHPINRIEELLPWNLATSTEPERSQVA